MFARAGVNQTTAEQLLSKSDDGMRYELVDGELRMMSPAGGRHGRVALNMALLLGNHVRANRLGAVYAAETGFILSRNPDTVRAPDVAFVAKQRADAIADDRGYVPLAPDLAIEVMSPGDSFAETEQKAFQWINAGTRLVLLVDPEAARVHAYRSVDDIRMFELNGGELDAEDVVPGWKIKIADAFS